MLHNESAQIFIPDGIPVDKALERTTHLGVCAHQDDVEIMAIDGVLKCYQHQDQWFTGVVVTNGAGSAREGIYADYSDEDMQAVRAKEQLKAAYVGEYAAQYLLDYTSAAVKDSANRNLVDDLRSIFKATQPEIIYTHNLADKHPTHVAVVLRTIEAIRSLPESERPTQLIGCEVWRDLGWMLDEDKVVFDTSGQENLQTALVGIFDSQVSGGKRYDLATMGRRFANATYFDSHAVDVATGMAFGMDLTPLIKDLDINIISYVEIYINRFADDVRNLIGSMF
jgi:LmbE family N-acetylglucosaminyl deacetylase